MSKAEIKQIIINVKELILAPKVGKEQNADDLLRFLVEQLPQIEVNRNGDQLEITMSEKLSKKAVKLRIKKFLHQKNLFNDFRPIFYRTHELEGYMIKKRKVSELSYY
ncbi:MAG: 60S ribosomal protein L22 [Promethearchaeota archaeon]